MPLKRIVVLVSGGGSNLQTLIDACASGMIPGEIVWVLSSSEKAYALTRAKENGIAHEAMPRKAFDTVEACDMARHEAILWKKPDIIVLAGYLGILRRETIAAFPNRILNTHPALIPSFCGPGMYGHHVHEAVLSYGAKISGATVHLVEEGVDTGPIVMQESVPVLDDDTPDTLQQRVLAAEHRLLPVAVKAMAEGRLVVSGRHVRLW